jgi:RNA ligase (TIGR02306 family)
MSEFRCEVVRVQIEEHPNADAIEIARVGDYQSIVRKGQFKNGDLAVYIPEQAVVPEWLLKEIGLWDEAKKGGLAGSAGNRVRAVKLRGVLSQGLMFGGDQLDDEVLVMTGRDDKGLPFGVGLKEGADAAEHLGIVKYEPPLPSHFGVHNIPKEPGAHLDTTHKYDFDNLKKMPTMFDDGEEVVITEKVHGTLIQVGVVPTAQAKDEYFAGRVLISSKGMGARGYIIDHNDETNLYAQAAKKHGLLESMLERFGEAADRHGQPIFIIGEVFGKTASGAGVQDLTYTDEVLDFRAFDICIGNRGTERYLEWDHFVKYVQAIEVQHVPLLYRGPYSKQVVLEHTDGNTTLSDKKQIREGVVVKSAFEARNRHFGRKIAKSVSEAYLLRKNATEFN